MNSEWPVINLNELCLKITDGAHQSPKSVSTGKPMASVKDLTRFGVDLSSARLISIEDFDLLVKQGCNPEVGDVLIAKDGNSALDTVCSVDSKLDAVLLSSVAILRPDQSKIFPHYLKHYLSSPDVIYYLKSNFISGAAIPRVVLKDFKKAEIRVPPLPIQMGIASVLDAIDDQIALLHETNATLEAIAQALFKSWFVDFDPVRAKAAGLEPEGMNAATAVLFPDSFEESKLGLVPSGWKVGKVEDMMELPYGKALKATDRVDGPVPVYGSGGITGCHNESLVNGPSVIVGRKGTVGSLYWEDRPFFPIDTVFYVRTDNPLTYCYYLLQTLGLEDMNTDGAVPGLNRNNAYRLPVVVATTSIIESFDEIVSSLRNKMFSNSQHTQTLTQLRDTLLPRLISGQLRLPEAEVMVEEICA